jgi:hypothetical protein
MSDDLKWLVDRRKALSDDQVDELDRHLAAQGGTTRGTGSGRQIPTLAVTIHDVVIHDNRKWFGGADLRIDALVITGYGQKEDPHSFYMPKTATFNGVRDGETLPIGPGGLLVFHGGASHFVDLLLMVSRDRRDSDELATVMRQGLGSSEAQTAVGALVALAATDPQVAAVTAGVQAASVLGDLAYRVLRAATGNTVGVFRTSHLEVRDKLGIGKHPAPPQAQFRVNDLSFRYEISREKR